MQALALTVLPVLLRTTLGLALAAAVVELVLRVARLQSPRVHRIGWLVALAVGWTFVGWPVEVPWYPASATVDSGPAIEDAAVTTMSANPSPLVVLQESPTDSTINAAGTSAPSMELGSDGTRHDLLTPASAAPADFDSEIALAPTAPSDAPWNSWPLWLAGTWAVGMLAAAANWLVAYVRFISLVRRARGAEAALPSPWHAEWRRLLDTHNVRPEIPLVATTNVGPSLCRLPRGYVLLVPREVWSTMSSAMRQAILRHELTHLLRGDVWWSLAARVLALPHWFNPAGWWCVRRFDEAAEWACDRAAISELPATQFATLLVNLGAATEPHSFNPAARGRGLAMRIRRLLSGETREDSTMKKLFVLISAALVIAAAVVRVELVAQEPATAPQAPEAPAAPAPTAAPRAAGGPSLELTFEAADDDSRGLTKELVDVSQQGFTAAMLSYQNGKASLELVCDWSRRWLAAELELDSDPARQVEYCWAHLTRMEKLHEQVEALHKATVQGGEPERLALISYYVVQAKRDLAKAEHRTQRHLSVVLPVGPVNEPARPTQPAPAAVPTPARAPSLAPVAVPTPAPPALVPTPATAPAAAPRRPALAPEPAVAPQPRPTSSEGVDARSARYDGKGFDEWVALLEHELSPAKRAEAVQALTAFGVQDEALAPVVAQHIMRAMRRNRQRDLDKSPAGQLLSAALNAFVEIDSEAILPVLTGALRSEDTGEVRFALQAFVFGVKPPPDSLRRLVELTKNANPEIRYDAVRALARVDRSSPAIVAALADESSLVAYEAILTIVPLERPGQSAYRWPTPSEGVIEELKRLAADQKRSQSLRVEAIEALGRLGTAAATALPTLEELARSPDSILKSHALRAFNEITKQSAAAEPIVPTPATPSKASTQPATEPPLDSP